MNCKKKEIIFGQFKFFKNITSFQRNILEIQNRINNCITILPLSIYIPKIFLKILAKTHLWKGIILTTYPLSMLVLSVNMNLEKRRAILALGFWFIWWLQPWCLGFRRIKTADTQLVLALLLWITFNISITFYWNSQYCL